MTIYGVAPNSHLSLFEVALYSYSYTTEACQISPRKQRNNQKLWNFDETLILKKVCVDEIDNGVAKEIYETMIIPILTFSSTASLHFNATQCKQLECLETRISNIVQDQSLPKIVNLIKKYLKCIGSFPSSQEHVQSQLDNFRAENFTFSLALLLGL